MFGVFAVLVVTGVLLGMVCIMGAVAWALERLIIWFERRNRHA
jgi:hypothetical protein